MGGMAWTTGNDDIFGPFIYKGEAIETGCRRSQRADILVCLGPIGRSGQI